MSWRALGWEFCSRNRDGFGKAESRTPHGAMEKSPPDFPALLHLRGERTPGMSDLREKDPKKRQHSTSRAKGGIRAGILLCQPLGSAGKAKHG